jgi:hypothetical protein
MNLIMRHGPQTYGYDCSEAILIRQSFPFSLTIFAARSEVIMELDIKITAHTPKPHTCI